MNQKLKKQIIKSLAVLFSVIAFFTVTSSNTFYAVKYNNEAQANANQKNLNKQLLDLVRSDYKNHCCTKLITYENLIKQGADVNAMFCCISTPLHYAARSGNFELCKLLLDNGANVNAKDCFGNTPLHEAIGFFRDIKEWQDKLMRNYMDYYYDTYGDAFFNFFRDEVDRNVELIQLLLDRGADINAQDNDGRCPLAEACLCGHKLAIDFLLTNDNLNINLSDKHNRPLFYYFIDVCYQDACEALIKKGVKINKATVKYARNWAQQCIGALENIFSDGRRDRLYFFLKEKYDNSVK